MATNDRLGISLQWEQPLYTSMNQGGQIDNVILKTKVDINGSPI